MSAKEEIKAMRFSRHLSAFDIDLDALEEKPWRQPGVDLTEYFNYGFNEAAWRDYAERQLRLRMEEGKGPAPPPPPVAAINAAAPPQQASTAAPVSHSDSSPVVVALSTPAPSAAAPAEAKNVEASPSAQPALDLPPDFRQGGAGPVPGPGFPLEMMMMSGMQGFPSFMPPGGMLPMGWDPRMAPDFMPPAMGPMGPMGGPGPYNAGSGPGFGPGPAGGPSGRGRGDAVRPARQTQIGPMGDSSEEPVGREEKVGREQVTTYRT